MSLRPVSLTTTVVGGGAQVRRAWIRRGLVVGLGWVYPICVTPGVVDKEGALSPAVGISFCFPLLLCSLDCIMNTAEY